MPFWRNLGKVNVIFYFCTLFIIFAVGNGIRVSPPVQAAERPADRDLLGVGAGPDFNDVPGRGCGNGGGGLDGSDGAFP